MTRITHISIMPEAEEIYKDFKKVMPHPSFSWSLAMAAEAWMRHNNKKLSAVMEENDAPEFLEDDISEWRKWYKSLMADQKKAVQRKLLQIMNMVDVS